MYYRNLILSIVVLIEVIYILHFWWKYKGVAKNAGLVFLFLVWLWPVGALVANLITLQWGDVLFLFNLIAVTLIPPIFWIFAYYFPGEKEEEIKLSSFIYIGLAPLLLVGIMIYDRELISQLVDMINKGEIFAGVLSQLYAIYLLIYLIASARHLSQKAYKLDLEKNIKKPQINKIENNQINYLLTGYFGAIIISLASNVATVVFANNDWLLLGFLGSFVLIVFFVQAFLVRQLADIRFVLRRGLIYGVFGILSLAFYLVIIFLLYIALVDYLQMSIVSALLIIPLILFIGYQIVRKWIIKFIYRFLYYRDYSTEEMIERITNILLWGTMDLKIVIGDIMKTLHDVFKPKKILFFLMEKDEQCMVPYQEIGFGETEEEIATFAKIGKFCATTNFFEYLQKRKEIIEIDDLAYKCRNEDQKACSMVSELKNLSVALVVPVQGQNRLLGCFFLDYKKSGEIYNPRDIKLLKLVAQQIVAHLENARRSTELNNFNITLQAEIESATKKLKKTNRKLREVAKAKSEFASIVAHQLRAPLTVMKGYLSMMYDGTLGKLIKKQKSAVIKTYRSTEDLIDLVENLLNFAKLDDNRLSFDFADMYLDQVVDDLLGQFELQLDSKKLKVSVTKKPENLPVIKADFNKLKNVVANLLDNAIKYTSDGGSIDIKITADVKKMVFEISDNGIGMVPADAKHLFEKFYRSKEMSFKHICGTGLGLFIIQRFITAHNGEVWASSKGRGKGSTFGFSLPHN